MKKINKHSRLPIVYDPFSRRMFLKGTGSMMAIPFLSSLVSPSEAQAATDNYFMFSIMTHGRHELAWYPQGVPLNNTNFQNVRARTLASVEGSMGLGAILRNNFNNYRNKMTLLQGLDFIAATGNHDQPVFTASSGLDIAANYRPRIPLSIDSVLSKSSKVYSSAPPVRVLRINPMVGGASYHFFDDVGNGTPNSAPAYGKTLGEVWNLVKNHINPSGGGGTTPPTTPTNFDPAKRKLLVDRFLAEFKSVANGTSISKDDKLLMQNATEHLSDLQKKLASVSTGAPPTPPPSMNIPLPNVSETNDVDLFNQRMIDIMTVAMAYNVTRVGTYNINWESCASPNGPVGNYHADWAVHQCHLNFNNAYQKCVDWWVHGLKKYAYMIQRMDQLNLIDKSLMMFTSDYSTSSGQHHGLDMPVLMAGSLGGKFETGQWIDYRDLNATPLRDSSQDDAYELNNGTGGIQKTRWQVRPGRPINDLYSSIFAAIGVPANEYQTPGRTGFGEYPDNLPLDPKWTYSTTEILRTKNWYAANAGKFPKYATLPLYYKG